MDSNLHHPELTADVSGAARAHSLQEKWISMKVLGAVVEKQVQFHHRCALLGFHRKKSILL